MEGMLWVFLGHRKCNAVTVSNSFPLYAWTSALTPWEMQSFFRPWTQTTATGKSKLPKKTEHKTLLAPHHGLYQFFCMPCGLKNPPGISTGNGHHFVHSLLAVCKSVPGWHCHIFQKASEAHIKHVTRVSALLHDARVTIKLKNCTSFSSGIKILSHVIYLEQLAVSQHTVDLIPDLRFPANITCPRSFMAMTNAFRRFVPKFAPNAAQLSQK